MAKKTRSKKKVARKAPAKRKPAAAKARAKKTPPSASSSLNGWITHTEFASSDPDGLKAWLTRVLSWKFRQSMPMPDGSEYHLYMYSDMGGGGIRVTGPGEDASTVPYVQVASVSATYKKAIAAGAQAIIAPEVVMGELYIACVTAPGGVAIGFAGPK
jgi:predicted enzyme related to lactoylglutathione lyase